MANTVSELEVKITADMSGLETSLRSAGQQVSSFGESVQQGLGLGVGMSVIQGGIQAIGAAFGALKGSVVDFNQQLDASRAVFTRYFEGNQATAESFLNTLKQFATATPFEFKDLTPLAARLAAVNVNAQDIIPTMKAIGNAASTSGQVSQESVDRIGLAITQMLGKGKVQAEEMNQLVEGGMTDAWHVLAQQVGVSDSQIRQLVTDGKVMGTTMVEALRSSYENAGLMDQAAKTLGGSLSTIRDVGTQAFADIGRSVYDLATAGAGQIATFLQSADFQVWVSAAKVGMDALVQAIKDVGAALAPLGELIATVFHQLTAGDFAGAWATLSTAVSNAIEQARTVILGFVDSLFGAGVSMISELAGGMIAGANSVLNQAVSVVADTIAAFLIGQSPPPKGPLADIEQGGANTIEAWGKGAAGAADAAVKPAVAGIKAQIDGLKESGRDVEAAIRDVGRSIQEIERESRDLKYTADDIKSTYDDQIKALDDQIKSVTDIHDVERDREKLNLSLEEIQLRQAEIAAMGDRETRARLQTQLDALKASTAERKNKEALADAEKEVAGSEKDRLKAEMEASKMRQQEADLRSKLKETKDPKERARIQEQLKELDQRKQIAAIEAQEREQAAQRRQADAQAKAQELSVQQQINGLVDKEALAKIKAQQDDVKARKEALTLEEQAAKLQAEIAVGPLKEERAALVAERDAMLKPLQEQLETLGKQKAVLSDQRQDLQGIKQDLAANTAELQAQVKTIGEAGKAMKDAAASVPTPKVDKSFVGDVAGEAAVNAAKEAGGRLAKGVSDGFTNLFTSLVPPAVRDGMQKIIDTLKSDGFPGLLAVIGAGLQSAVPVFATGLVKWLNAYLDWAAELQPKVLDAMTSLIDGILDWIEKNAGPIASQLTTWRDEFLAWIIDAAPKLLDKLADLSSNVLSWIGETTTKIVGKLVEWATAYVEWVAPQIPHVLEELGKFVAAMVEWMGQHLGELLDALGRWAVSFVEWVAPKIPPLLLELAKLLLELTGWIITTALPAIVEKLAEWGAAVVDWVLPRIPLLIEALGKLLLEMGNWIVTTAGPAIIEKLKTWAAAFLDWIAESVLPSLAQKLDDIKTGIATWVRDSIDSIKTSAANVGAGMLEGIKQGLSDNWSTLANWITENIGKKLPEWVQQLLGIKSPSSVFHDIGENIVLGLISGMAAKRDELIKSATKLFGFDFSNFPGDRLEGDALDAVLKQAMRMTRVGDEWFDFLGWLVEHESGGWFRGPRSVNPVDVGNGEHASGLFQTIPSTFGRHRSRDLPDDIFNPLANAVAAIRYINAAYDGDIDDIRRNWAQRGGYAQGGWAGLHGPELAWLGERGPEYVVPNDALRAGVGSVEHIVLDVALDGRTMERIYITGRDIALRRGRSTAGVGTSGNLLAGAPA